MLGAPGRRFMSGAFPPRLVGDKLDRVAYRFAVQGYRRFRKVTQIWDPTCSDPCFRVRLSMCEHYGALKALD